MMKEVLISFQLCRKQKPWYWE